MVRNAVLLNYARHNLPWGGNNVSRRRDRFREGDRGVR